MSPEEELQQLIEGVGAENVLIGYEWGQAYMYVRGEIEWMSEQDDSIQMVSAQQFARNLLDDEGK